MGDKVKKVPREDDIVKHVKHMFGWHGGMGDPPVEDAIRAIIRGTREYMTKALGQKIEPWHENTSSRAKVKDQ